MDVSAHSVSLCHSNTCILFSCACISSYLQTQAPTKIDILCAFHPIMQQRENIVTYSSSLGSSNFLPPLFSPFMCFILDLLPFLSLALSPYNNHLFPAQFFSSSLASNICAFISTSWIPTHSWKRILVCLNGCTNNKTFDKCVTKTLTQANCVCEKLWII